MGNDGPSDLALARLLVLGGPEIGPYCIGAGRQRIIEPTRNRDILDVVELLHQIIERRRLQGALALFELEGLLTVAQLKKDPARPIDPELLPRDSLAFAKQADLRLFVIC